MTIKLIATDMDGTLLRTDKTFDYTRFESLLDQMDARGIKMVAASGNQLKQLQSYFNPVDPKRLTYVSSNGAMVSDHEGVLYKRPVPKDKIAQVLAWNRENHAMMENLIVLSGLKGAYVSNHATPEIIAQVSQFYTNVVQVEKFMAIDDDIFVIELVWPETANVVEYIRELRDVFGEELHTTGSGFGSVSILAANTNKETGLSALSDIWQIKPEEMAAFGDNGNDLEMLRYVGLPFVMPNAEDFMKVRIANEALNDNEHNGVLDTIEAILAGAYDQDGTIK
ncbi:HAD family hydrolase [Weissella diestrammenae]|uniref:HAD family hydrolase n=1 Tax=Weissella diestrammenae TaxID=1162633 RepID=A0A7G9T3X1_9LACO|nr:Cof-type HAD-IIB family hydrolase [Weissella diestrammenae]MCM0582121.1 HAD family hydrolase [Weissella diestrammenae]QNN74796.1 HAD family hydrolase [Weissella diestrammenae]